LNLLDSSGWLEIFGGGANAAQFALIARSGPQLIVPAICLLEVYKRVLQVAGEDEARIAVVHMRAGSVVALDDTLAIEAATVSHQHKLSLADSVIYATAQRHSATLWTQDEHFQRLPGVKFFKKR
jgi:predicted nucleic acid-binding protein